MDSLTSTLIALSGQENVVVVRKPFVKFTGSLEGGLLLGQMLYWTPRARVRGNFVAKSDKEFCDEIGCKRARLRSARKALEAMGILETELHRFNGAPTTHYRLNLDELNRQWIEWLHTIDYAESHNPSSESAQCLTETTSESTVKDSEPDGSVTPSKPTLFTALAEVCQIDIDKNMITVKQRGQLNAESKRLRKAGIDPDGVQDFGVWWYAHDWRGMKYQPPDPSQIRSMWKQYKNWKPGGNGVLPRGRQTQAEALNTIEEWGRREG